MRVGVPKGTRHGGDAAREPGGEVDAHALSGIASSRVSTQQEAPALPGPTSHVTG